MDPSVIDLARISQQLVVAALQAVASYDQAQRQLDLVRVLEPERLTSPEGIAQSRNTLTELAALTAQHKQFFETFMIGATERLLAAASQIPEDRRQSFSESLARTINYNLAAQAGFYAGRERWIAAATQALALAKQHEGDIWLEDGELVFASSALLEQIRELAAQMDQVHEAEVALLQERQAHIAAAIRRAGEQV